MREVGLTSVLYHYSAQYQFDSIKVFKSEEYSAPDYLRHELKDAIEMARGTSCSGTDTVGTQALDLG